MATGLSWRHKFEEAQETWRQILESNGLSIPSKRKKTLLKICKEIEKKAHLNYYVRYSYPIYGSYEDLKENKLLKNYKELGFEVFQDASVDWKQVEGKLRQMLLEYFCDKYDEFMFRINSRTWYDVFKTKGLGISSKRKHDLFKICQEIENKANIRFGYPSPYGWGPDSKEKKLHQKYEELGFNVLQDESIDWKQIEGRLRHVLLEYFFDEYDEFRFRIKSMTWCNAFKTKERRIPEHIRNSLLELCMEIENEVVSRGCPSCESFIRRYQRLGQHMLEMEIVDWDDIRKSLRQIIADWNRARGFEGISVEDLDGKQHVIYKRSSYTKDLDYLINEVADITGISKKEFVLMYRDKCVIPGKDLFIPDGAKLQLLPLEKVSCFKGIIVEDLDGKQHVIYKMSSYTNDLDYLVNEVADKTGISKKDFVLMYRENCVIPGKDLYIPDGAKLHLLPLEKERGFEGITVEDLDGKQHVIHKRSSYTKDLEYLINEVADITGISKNEFVLMYGDNCVIPGKDLFIPDGAKLHLLPLEKVSCFKGIIVEDLDGKQHVICKRSSYTSDLDYLVNEVADKTGISKKEFVLMYGENCVIPGKDLFIPNGAKLHLLPLEKDQKPPADINTFVRGIFNELYGKIDRLFKNFPKVFEDTTRLLSEKDFVKISQLIGKGWGMLGIELGLSKVKLQQITEDKPNVASRIFEMLCQWGQARKGGATAAQLFSAVRKSGVSCEFDKLQRALLIGL